MIKRLHRPNALTVGNLLTLVGLHITTLLALVLVLLYVITAPILRYVRSLWS